MRYWEIIEAGKPDHDAEHDPQERAELWRKLDSARHKGSRAGQDYQDSVRSADNEQRKAQQKLAENGNDETDPDTEHQQIGRASCRERVFRAV